MPFFLDPSFSQHLAHLAHVAHLTHLTDLNHTISSGTHLEPIWNPSLFPSLSSKQRAGLGAKGKVAKVWLRAGDDDAEADAPMDLLDPTMARRVTTQVCAGGGPSGSEMMMREAQL